MVGRALIHGYLRCGIIPACIGFRAYGLNFVEYLSTDGAKRINSCDCEHAKIRTMRYLPLLLILISVRGYTQDIAPPAKATKFRIGVNVSLDQAYRRQGWHNAIHGSVVEARNIKHTESPGLSYGTNIRLGYAIGP